MIESLCEAGCVYEPTAIPGWRYHVTHIGPRSKHLAAGRVVHYTAILDDGVRKDCMTTVDDFCSRVRPAIDMMPE